MPQSKFQFILIAVFAAFILIGVFIFAFGGRGSGKGNATVLLWGTVPRNVFSDLWEKSTLSKNKNISLTYVEKSKEKFDSDFVNALAEGTGPDLILLSSDMVLKEKNKILILPYNNYSERTFKDTFAEAGEVFLFPEGVAAIPFAIDPLITFWNRDIFTNAGLANPPGYWDEFYKLGETLTKKDGAFNLTLSTTALGEYRNVTNAKSIFGALAMQAGTPIVTFVNGAPTSVLGNGFDLPIPPGQAALSFYTEFSNPTKSYYTWNRSLPLSQSAFLSGDLATYFGFASEFPLLKLKNPNLNFDVATFPQSSNVREGSRRLTLSKVYGISIVKNSRVVGPAFTVVLGITGKDFSTSLARALGLSPARRDALSSPNSNLIDPVSYQSALVSRAWLDPNPDETEGIFANMIESVTGGRARPQGAVTQASKEIAELLKK